MKKKALIILGIIITIIVGIITYFVITDLNQEEKLRTELTEINNLVAVYENIDMNKINKKLDTIITTGDYAIVEKSL